MMIRPYWSLRRWQQTPHSFFDGLPRKTMMARRNGLGGAAEGHLADCGFEKNCSDDLYSHHSLFASQPSFSSAWHSWRLARTTSAFLRDFAASIRSARAN